MTVSSNITTLHTDISLGCKGQPRSYSLTFFPLMCATLVALLPFEASHLLLVEGASAACHSVGVYGK